MPKFANEELSDCINLADSKKDFISSIQAQKNSDFVNKDRAPYGVLAGLGLLAGAASIIVAECSTKWDSKLKNSIRGVGIGLIILGVLCAVAATVFEYKDNEIKSAVSRNTVKALDAQTENDISTSDAYTAALMYNAGDQITNWSNLGVASSKIDLNNKINQSAMNTGSVAKLFSEEELGTGISNLNTLNSNGLNQVTGYMKY